MRTHVIYVAIILIVAAGGLLAAKSYAEHVKDDAVAEAEIKNLEQRNNDIEKKRDTEVAQLQDQIKAIQLQKAQVVQVPSEAPKVLEQLLKQFNPQAAPIAQTAPITQETPKDAKVGELTNQNYQDLTQAALSCSQCYVEKQQLQKKLDADEELLKNKDKEITTIKQPEGFWHRLKHNSNLLLIGGVIAVAVEHIIIRRHNSVSSQNLHLVNVPAGPDRSLHDESQTVSQFSNDTLENRQPVCGKPLGRTDVSLLHKYDDLPLVVAEPGVLQHPDQACVASH